MAVAAGISCGCAASFLPAAATEEERIEERIHEWFTLLEDHAHGTRPSDRLLTGPPFELALADGRAPDPDALRAWLDELRSPHPHVEFRVAALRVSATDEGLYRARFELDRTAVDEEGIPHVTSWRHVWLVDRVAEDAPRVVRIEESSSLVFPGTGTRIICN